MKKHEGRIFKCEKCDYSSLTFDLLKLHTKEKHCEPRQNDKCSECEYAWRMKRHLQAKHENNSFMCHFCDFVARSKSLLVSHKICAHTMFMFNLP